MAAPKDGDQQGSIDVLQKDLEANPFNTSLISKLAETYANRGDYNNACQLYEKLVRLDEDNGRAWTALGHCYLLKAEYQKCFTAYQKALYTLPHTRDPQLWYGIALLYNKFDTYEYAEPAYQAVLRIDPNFEQKNEVFFKLGQIYKKTAAYDNAVSYLRNSMVGDAVPLNRKVDALCSIGVCYEKQSKLANAIEIYREALDLERTNFKTMEYLGWALAQGGKEDESVEQLQKALESVGNSSAEEGDIHYLLGRCYLLQKKYSEGQTEFQKAIFKNPNSYIYWCSIGVLYAKASQPQDAFECFIKASNITQEESESWFNMGILYEHCGQSLEAVLAYQRAMTIDSKNTEAAKRKEELQDRSRAPPPPDYIHPKFEISDLPFSLQKSEKSKKPNQLPGIDQHKPGELAPAALQPETPAATPPPPSPRPTTVSIPHVAAQRTDPSPKPETLFSFSREAPPTPPAEPTYTAFPQMGAQFPGQGMPKPGAAQVTQQFPPMQAATPQQSMASQMASMQAAMQASMSQGMTPGMTAGAAASLQAPTMSAMTGMQSAMAPAVPQTLPQQAMSPMPNALSPQAMQSAMATQTMPPQSVPQQAMAAQAMQGTMQAMPGMPPMGMQGPMQGPMQGAMQGTMASGMPGALSPQALGAMAQSPLGGVQPGMGMPGGSFMGNGVSPAAGFNPMAGMMGSMGMNPMGMNPFAGMNPVMMGQMMQMMYMQQMAMMRSMFGMGRGAPPAQKPETEQQNSSNSDSVETRSGQKRKGDSLPDTRTKRR